MKLKRNDYSAGNILIVEDDPAVLVLMQAILKTANHRVLPAENSDDAIRLAGQRHLRIDAVVVDVRMPIVALGLAHAIVSLRPNVPVLFVFGIVDNEIVRIKLLQEYSQFLREPPKNHCLLEAVSQAIGLPVLNEPFSDRVQALRA